MSLIGRVHSMAVGGLISISLLCPVHEVKAADPAVTPPGPAGLDTSRLLRKKLWIIETRGVPGVTPTDRQMREHLEHQMAIEKAGVLFAAGPVSGVDPPYGMIIVRAASREDAQRIADSDPMHLHKLRTYVLKEWMLNEGRINVTLNFSDGSYRFE